MRKPVKAAKCGGIAIGGQKNDLSHIRRLQYYTTGRVMELDLDARRNLELTESLRAKEKKGTLLWVLDKTQTAMGGRMIRSWLEKPLLDPAEIGRRHSAVEELVNDPICRGELTAALKDVTDFERVMARVVTGTVNCRDLLGLARGLRALPQVKAQLENAEAPLLQRLAQAIDPLTDCADYIENTIVDDPPLTVREGGIIRKGANAEADRLRDIMEGGAGTIAAIHDVAQAIHFLVGAAADDSTLANSQGRFVNNGVFDEICTIAQ